MSCAPLFGMQVGNQCISRPGAAQHQRRRLPQNCPQGGPHALLIDIIPIGWTGLFSGRHCLAGHASENESQGLFTPHISPLLARRQNRCTHSSSGLSHSTAGITRTSPRWTTTWPSTRTWCVQPLSNWKLNTLTSVTPLQRDSAHLTHWHWSTPSPTALNCTIMLHRAAAPGHDDAAAAARAHVLGPPAVQARLAQPHPQRRAVLHELRPGQGASGAHV